MEDYFIERPIFSEDEFRRKYLMGLSRVFDRVVTGNSQTLVFHVNGKWYNNAYYLADEIYPKYSTFVKTIANPMSQSQKLFGKKQETFSFVSLVPLKPHVWLILLLFFPLIRQFLPIFLPFIFRVLTSPSTFEGFLHLF